PRTARTPAPGAGRGWTRPSAASMWPVRRGRPTTSAATFKSIGGMNDVTFAQPAQAPAGGLKASGAFFVETVTWVQHWTSTLFSFRTTRDPGLRFSSGQFVMVGLQKEDGKPLVRAYSIA